MSSAMISALVVTGNARLRDTLSRRLDESGRCTVAVCASVLEAVRRAPRLRAEVVLLELRLAADPASDAIPRLHAALPQAEVVVLTNGEDREAAIGALLAGAGGCVPASAPAAALVATVEAAARGGAPVPPAVARRLLEHLRRLTASKAGQSELTAREQEILGWLDKGYQYKEISSQLSISLDTVRTHIRHLYSKLGVRSRREAILKCHSASLQAGGSTPPPIIGQPRREEPHDGGVHALPPFNGVARLASAGSLSGGARATGAGELRTRGLYGVMPIG